MELHKGRNNRSQDFISVTLHIQVAIDEMQTCALSMVKACTHHDTTAPMSHPSQDISLSITLTNTAPNTDSAISMSCLRSGCCEVELGPGVVEVLVWWRSWCGRGPGVVEALVWWRSWCGGGPGVVEVLVWWRSWCGGGPVMSFLSLWRRDLMTSHGNHSDLNQTLETCSEIQTSASLVFMVLYSLIFVVSPSGTGLKHLPRETSQRNRHLSHFSWLLLMERPATLQRKLIWTVILSFQSLPKAPNTGEGLNVDDGKSRVLSLDSVPSPQRSDTATASLLTLHRSISISPPSFITVNKTLRDLDSSTWAKTLLPTAEGITYCTLLLLFFFLLLLLTFAPSDFMSEASYFCFLSAGLCLNILSCVLQAGLVLNIFSLRVHFCSRSRLHSSVSVFLKNLSASDLLLILSLPIRIAHYASGPALSSTSSALSSTSPAHVLHRFYCSVGATFFYLNMYASIFFMGYIAANRYLKIVRPLQPHPLQTYRGSRLVSALTWVVLWVLAGVYVGVSLLSSRSHAPQRSHSCDSAHSHKGLLFQQVAHSLLLLLFVFVLGPCSSSTPPSHADFQTLRANDPTPAAPGN
ncbi:hypothetical protein WMY93_028116 [Mugilogobius chulae]|uniref:G-protein coupled receptors family 1 profile domain-containing protein n=1 Tax=Mugilogobius chulae TaxID=88201 RepID=A0AAW0MXM4_9GOBI